MKKLSNITDREIINSKNKYEGEWFMKIFSQEEKYFSNLYWFGQSEKDQEWFQCNKDFIQNEVKQYENLAAYTDKGRVGPKNKEEFKSCIDLYRKQNKQREML